MHRTSLLVVSAIVGIVSVGEAQQPVSHGQKTGVVRVKVVDSVTAQPIVRAGVQATGWRGLAWTDTTGTFTMTGVPLASELRIRCPTTRRLAGRIVRRQDLTLDTPETTVVIRLAGAECVEPPIQSTHGEFRGHYTSGFESSDFRPCEGLPPAAKAFDDSWGAAWVSFAPGFDLRKVKWPTVADTTSPALYVRWQGTLTGPGSYGHLGVATYQFVVDRILEIRAGKPGDCR
jgi:hypothetical protein